MNLDLIGRKAIVTGASRGLGAATAAALAAEGVNVALVSRDAGALAAHATEIERAHGVRAVAIEADLASAAAVNRGIQQAIEALGGVDILVNNAGASPGGSFDACTDENWTNAIDLKLLGYTRVIRAVLPTMRGQGRGRIVNVVGLSGRQASPQYILGALNAALLHLSRSLAIDLAAQGITVMAVNPHLVETDRVRDYLGAQAASQGSDLDAVVDELVRTLPLRRMGTAEEVARMVTIMASDVMEYATGTALQADGANGLSI